MIEQVAKRKFIRKLTKSILDNMFSNKDFYLEGNGGQLYIQDSN